MREKEQVARQAEGKTTIARGVLVTIAKLSALGVPGVVAMASAPTTVRGIFDRGAGDGVVLHVHNQSVALDLYLVLKHDTNVREVSRNVQTEVARAIEDMAGMEVERVDVHIEEIDYGENGQ